MLRRRKNPSRPQKFDYVQRDDVIAGTSRDASSGESRQLSSVTGQSLSASQIGSASRSRPLTETGSLKPFRRQRGRATALSSTNNWSDVSESVPDHSDQETAISMTNLKAKCKLLLDYSHIDRMELERSHPEIFKEFMKVVYLGKAIVTKPTEYKEYMRIIGEVFGEDEVDERGTIGDFMYGCYKEQSIPGRKGCTPECAGSLPRHDSLPGDICNEHVGIYKNKLSLNFSPSAASSNVLNIHAYKKKIKLSHEELEDLSDRGIEHFKVYWHTVNPGATIDQEDIQTYNIKKIQSNIGKGGYVSCRSDSAERFHRSRDTQHKDRKSVV